MNARHTLRFLSDSPGDTAAFGEALGGALRGGETIGLRGDLGAGKTLLTQAVARALGVRGPVPSPTFVLERRHQGDALELCHWDFYRLDADSDLDELGFFERLPTQVVAVEWMERHPEAFDAAHTIVIRIDHGDDEPARRVVTVEIPAAFAYVADALAPFAGS